MAKKQNDCYISIFDKINSIESKICDIKEKLMNLRVEFERKKNSENKTEVKPNE
jgi:hypothetical protein